MQITFSYAPDGNRVSKLTTARNTYYVRDASGNIMATYTLVDDCMTLDEQPIYGSSRLGVRQREICLDDEPVPDPDTDGIIYVWRGYKKYELSNHLGNVLTVVTDRRSTVCNEPDQEGDFINYEADILTVTDYYPFGAPMASRTDNQEGYRFGFNGQECDSELLGIGNTYAFEYRMHDARLGRFMSVDPLADEYSYNSPYSFAEDKPIISVDLEGLECIARLNSNEKKTSETKSSTPPKQDQIGPLYFGPNQDRFKKYFDSPVTFYPLSPSLGYQEQVFIKAPISFIYYSVDALYTFPQIFLDDFIPGEPRHINGELVGEGYHRTNAAMDGIITGTMFLPIPKTPRIGKGIGLDAKLCNPSKPFGFNWVIEPHANSLSSLKPNWGYRLYSNDGTFLKNGITSKINPESRYTKAFMADKKMVPVELFPTRRAAWGWEFKENTTNKGPLNKNNH